MRVTGVVLAGGKSSRMGRDKSLLPLDDEPAIAHVCNALAKACDDLIIISNHPDEYKFLGVPVYQDLSPGKGPLAGLHAAMHHHHSDAYILSACDMPFIQPDVYRFLIEQLTLTDVDAVIPVYGEFKQPLAAIYHRRALNRIEDLLEKDQLKLALLFDLIHVKYQDHLPFSNELLRRHFFNMNHPEEYDQAVQWIDK